MYRFIPHMRLRFIISHSSCAEQYGVMTADTHTHTHTYTKSHTQINGLRLVSNQLAIPVYMYCLTFSTRNSTACGSNIMVSYILKQRASAGSSDLMILFNPETSKHTNSKPHFIETNYTKYLTVSYLRCNFVKINFRFAI